MKEITMNWGAAVKIAWSIGWRFVLYLVPVNLLAGIAVLALVSYGSPLEGQVMLLNAVWFLLQLLWFAALAFGLLLAVRNVIGKSYTESSLPPVPRSFRIALVSDAE